MSGLGCASVFEESTSKCQFGVAKAVLDSVVDHSMDELSKFA